MNDHTPTLRPIREHAQLAHQDSLRWFPAVANDIYHHVLGLSGEAGEVANLIKKIQRGDYGSLQEAFENAVVKQQLEMETVDCLVYLLNIWGVLNTDVESVLAFVNKLNEQRFGHKQAERTHA